MGPHHGVPARGQPLAAYDARPPARRPRPRPRPPRRAPPSETHVALVAALKQLPEAQRQALVLHHIADLPVHDVAREVGVPEGTIKARLSRGRAALAALLADDAPAASRKERAMPDPIDELENFSTPGLRGPLPAAEVRRRGTRLRRRNNALAAIGGVAAVAIIATAAGDPPASNDRSAPRLDSGRPARHRR